MIEKRIDQFVAIFNDCGLEFCMLTNIKTKKIEKRKKKSYD